MTGMSRRYAWPAEGVRGSMADIPGATGRMPALFCGENATASEGRFAETGREFTGARRAGACPGLPACGIGAASRRRLARSEGVSSCRGAPIICGITNAASGVPPNSLTNSIMANFMAAGPRPDAHWRSSVHACLAPFPLAAMARASLLRSSCRNRMSCFAR